MSFFDTIGNFLSNLSGRKGTEERVNNYEEQARQERARAKQQQLDLLGQQKAPEYSDQYKARLKALEDESHPTSLSEDANFQGDRAALVQGGQQALSSVQNKQRAYGTSGGFSNQGSINDVYDRLGAQLAGLGQKSQALREHKRDLAAQGSQAMVDSKIAYENAITKARAAIESGDSQAALAAMHEAYAAKDAAAQNERSFYGQLIGGGIQGAAKASDAIRASGGTGLNSSKQLGGKFGPDGAADPSSTGSNSLFAGDDDPFSNPTYMDDNSQMPWSATRRRFS